MNEDDIIIEETGSINGQQTLNKGTDEETVCFGYVANSFRTVMYYLSILLSFGFVLLLFNWKPEWELFLKCSRSLSLENSKYVLLRDSHGRYSVSKVQSDSAGENETIIIFTYHMLRYIWKDKVNGFVKIEGLDAKTEIRSLLSSFTGYTAAQQSTKLNYYGKNSIQVEVKSYFRLFLEEIITPFYIFQIASCILWFLDDYFIYSTIIVLFSISSMIVSLVETKRQAQTLHDMTLTNIRVNVCRGSDTFEEVSTEVLVPGDVIEIPSGQEMLMGCDAVLMNGNCIVNESMLTGESVPVIKTPLPAPETMREIFDIEEQKRSVLYNGTQVMQTRNYEKAKVLAVVVRTGFSTSKGSLVRSILFPKPIGFKFYKDSIKFIGMMSVMALVGMTYGIIVLGNNGVVWWEVALRALDVITIVVPPALPAAMTVGTIYAQSRLKKKSIFCISPPRINVSGKIKLICFDKTGTLTEDSLDLWGVIKVNEQNSFSAPVNEVTELKDECQALRVLATCHSLSRFNGALTGDPLDVKMFKSTQWVFVDEHIAGSCKFEQESPVVKQYRLDEATGVEIAIIKQFTFSASLLRMTVLGQALEEDHLFVTTKGAPEKIKELCRPETIPSDFDSLLKIYTQNGYRVIGLAGKSLDSSISYSQGSKLTRDQIESQLNFHGFLIMQNKLKPETIGVIKELKQAALRTVMVTGDNLLTAINIARTCGMVPSANKVILAEASFEGIDRPKIDWKLADDYTGLEEGSTYQTQTNIEARIDFGLQEGNYSFALDGKSFAIISKYFPHIFEKILLNGTIYARMSPDQKAQLVERLIGIGYGVSMCGDGANDCSALKAAHVGISLSDAEASVAAPFTSKIQNITCVPEVIKEGRCSLVTSFGVFKYMALYSMIQFTTILILYWHLTNLSDPMFLYADLLLITPVAIFMSANKPHHKLSVKRPQGSLIGFVNLSSILLQVVLVIGFQSFCYIYAEEQTWYVPTNVTEISDIKENLATMETASVFLIAIFQYVAMAFVFSKGPPFRQPLYKNAEFTVSLLTLTAINIWVTVTPPETLRNAMQLVYLDPQNQISVFRISYVFIALLFFLLSYAIEELIVDTNWFKRLGRMVLRKNRPKNRYKLIQRNILSDTNWPLVDKTTKL